MNRTENQLNPSKGELRSHPRISELTPSAKIILLLIMHVPLAFLIRNIQLYSTVHAFFTLAVGVWIALTSKDIKSVIPVVAYITGAEVLWRMTRASIFWEYGKYATVAILMIALLKKRTFRKASLPLIYFILLLPSFILTIDTFGFSGITRNAISFNLSGPLAMFVCMMYFRQFETDVDKFSTWMWWAVYPIVSILSLAAYSTFTASTIQFGTESVFATSGGFGPNQVSAILGLGAMLLIMLAIQEEKIALRNLSLLLAIAVLVQSVLTFSRGGVLNVLIAIPLALVHLLGNPSKLMRGIFFILIIAAVAYFIFLPEVDQFTGGAFEARYTDLDTTGRLEIAKADINLWLENPILGVGPGLSSHQRTFMRGSPAHTEYSRLIAEHGSAGVLSLIILFIILISAYFRAPDSYTRAWMVALAAWPLVEMTHAAMRLVSISFLLGLAVINWKSVDSLNSGETSPD